MFYRALLRARSLYSQHYSVRPLLLATILSSISLFGVIQRRQTIPQVPGAQGTAATRTLGEATVVTAYYMFKSKHPHSKYIQWMKNFLSQIPCRLVIFTDNEMLPILKRYRQPYSHLTYYILKNFTDFALAKDMTVWRAQLKLDPEKDKQKHNENLYIMWNEKFRLVNEAISHNPFDTSYFVWCDIGSFRTFKQATALKSFPNPEKMILLNENKLLFLQTGNFSREEYETDKYDLPVFDFKGVNRVGGTVIAGHKLSWITWRQIYYDVMGRMIAAGRFVGKDQNVMASVAVLHPDIIDLIANASLYPLPHAMCLKYLTDVNLTDTSDEASSADVGKVLSGKNMALIGDSRMRDLFVYLRSRLHNKTFSPWAFSEDQSFVDHRRKARLVNSVLFLNFHHCLIYGSHLHPNRISTGADIRMVD
ncbi:hypothetical protein RvY_10550 [Ramazzottius varieornatus]|uniref:Uncharacterized protein n=1 Tax=Ramazzottius varieornatus TaxID=947166 RepID=A0A1D1VFJ0_RAMVA|nr:hypothetical protein RvY_10550 [Ramazzottius varieornatus]